MFDGTCRLAHEPSESKGLWNRSMGRKWSFRPINILITSPDTLLIFHQACSTLPFVSAIRTTSVVVARMSMHFPDNPIDFICHAVCLPRSISRRSIPLLMIFPHAQEVRKSHIEYAEESIYRSSHPGQQEFEITIQDSSVGFAEA